MNEKLQYASMLEIPVSTCNITYKPIKRRKTKKKKAKIQDVKEEVINLANNYVESQENLPEISQSEIEAQASEIEFEQEKAQPVSVKKKRKFSVISAQFLVIGCLIATIIATSVVNENSGLNVFFKSVFGANTQVEKVDDRVFTDFCPVIDEGILVDDSTGVMSFEGSDSAYACFNGVVKSVVKGEDGKFTMEIAHSQNFSSVISGLRYAYALEGDKVCANIPVGYYEQGYSMCFNGADGDTICNYEIIDGQVVWAV